MVHVPATLGQLPLGVPPPEELDPQAIKRRLTARKLFIRSTVSAVRAGCPCALYLNISSAYIRSSAHGTRGAPHLLFGPRYVFRVGRAAPRSAAHRQTSRRRRASWAAWGGHRRKL